MVYFLVGKKHQQIQVELQVFLRWTLRSAHSPWPPHWRYLGLSLDARAGGFARRDL